MDRTLNVLLRRLEELLTTRGDPEAVALLEQQIDTHIADQRRRAEAVERREGVPVSTDQEGPRW